jgi:tRNA(Arg) A34 adenosine deaminase TadA
MSEATADEQFMREAIRLSAKAGIEQKTGRCFGAVVVKDGAIIAEGYNQVRVHTVTEGHDWAVFKAIG